MDTLKRGVTIICILFLSAGFLGVGMLKLVDYPSIVTSFQKWGIPVGFKYILGVFEILLAVGIFYKPWRKYAAFSALAVMIGAIFIHVTNDEMSQLYGPFFVVVLLVFLLISDDLI